MISIFLRACEPEYRPEKGFKKNVAKVVLKKTTLNVTCRDLFSFFPWCFKMAFRQHWGFRRFYSITFKPEFRILRNLVSSVRIVFCEVNSREQCTVNPAEVFRLPDEKER